MVWLRGYPVSAPDEDGDAEALLFEVLVDVLVQALAVARVRAAATATVPHRANLLLAHCVLDLTCPTSSRGSRICAF
jgi:hypothetical protein